MTAQAVAERNEPDTQVAVQHEQTGVSIMALVSQAVSAGLPMETIRELRTMAKEEAREIAERAFYEAMRAVQEELPQIVRDADNSQTNSRYARYETISEAIQPIITKHGFSLSFGEADSPKENHMRIICDVGHTAGFVKQYHADIPIDMYGMKGNPNKTGPHAYGSTKSYGRRYLKCDIFDVAIRNEDDDGNAAGGTVSQAADLITPEQVKELQALIVRSKGTVEKFCQLGKIESIPDLQAVHFDAAKAMLMDRIRKIEERANSVDPKAQFDRMEAGRD